FHRVAHTSEHLRRHQLRSASGERFIANVGSFGMLTHGDRKQFNRLLCRVNAWLTRPDGGKRPDARRVVLGNALWLAALDPPEEARLVLPHVPGAVEYGSVFHPNDLLVNEGAVLFPHAFDEPLFPARVPTVPGCVGCDGV